MLFQGMVNIDVYVVDGMISFFTIPFAIIVVKIIQSIFKVK